MKLKALLCSFLGAWVMGLAGGMSGILSGRWTYDALPVALVGTIGLILAVGGPVILLVNAGDKFYRIGELFSHTEVYEPIWFSKVAVEEDELYPGYVRTTKGKELPCRLPQRPEGPFTVGYSGSGDGSIQMKPVKA